MKTKGKRGKQPRIEEAEKPAEVAKRRGVEPGSYGGVDVVARSIDLIAGSRGVDAGLQALE